MENLSPCPRLSSLEPLLLHHYSRTLNTACMLIVLLPFLDLTIDMDFQFSWSMSFASFFIRTAVFGLPMCNVLSCLYFLFLFLFLFSYQFVFFVDPVKLHQLAKWSRGSYHMDAYFCSPIFPEVVWKNWRGFRCWWYDLSQTFEQLQYLQFQWQQKDCSFNIKLVRRP